MLSVGLNEGIATVYNVGKIKETAAPDGRILSAIGSKARDATVSDTNVPQKSTGVNTQYMQDETGYAQTAEKPQYALISREMLEDGRGEVDSQEYSEQAMSEALERVREARRAGTEKSRREADGERSKLIVSGVYEIVEI